jgi:hypothetical protein
VAVFGRDPVRRLNRRRGATWIELRVTPTSFDHNLAPCARGIFLGDYTGLAVRRTEFLSAYATTTATDPASTLTP